MKTAIMQPYFLPYIGYFQLINLVDIFVIYDNIQYTKKGWINRNRYMLNGKDSYFTIPINRSSNYLSIKEKSISNNFDKKKLLSQITNAYRKAPHFKHTFPLLEEIVGFESNNLFNYILNSVNLTCNHLDIKTKIIKSADININHDLKKSDKVIAICKQLNSSIYINPIGGINLYSTMEFNKNNIEIFFLKSNPFTYEQFKNEFVPWLSILDVMMFNSKADVIDVIKNRFSLVTEKSHKIYS
ncbi:WbqC family protein [Labilibaculum antarcticum]|uniref:WbqC-like protein n=1 Tax=Labilibaculum antarcticum TaxID=1717717 RepID=A0A1Y1CGD5_9BACT|nr:WbqC family protein [Labilibaculum antarcticum]BAX79446.1 hypothetical protein ALGA_1060 [Labilibaculum antarcticum]